MNLIFGLILAFIVFLMANGLYNFLNRPKIVPINRDERDGEALLVIDMQEDFTRPPGKKPQQIEKLDAVNTVINEVAGKARQSGIPVIEVSHVFEGPLEKFYFKLTASGRGIEGSEGLKRDRGLTFVANFHVVKNEADSLSAPMLERFLEDHKIDHLYITGQEASACVNATAKGALARNYKVTLLEDGILASNTGKWRDLAAKLEQKGAVTKTSEVFSANR